MARFLWIWRTLVLAVFCSASLSVASAQTSEAELTDRVCAAPVEIVPGLDAAWSGEDFDCSDQAFNTSTTRLWLRIDLADLSFADEASHLMLTTSRQDDITIHVRDSEGAVAQSSFNSQEQARNWYVFDTIALPLPETGARPSIILIEVDRPWDPANWGAIRLSSSASEQPVIKLILIALFCGMLTAPLFMNMLFTLVLQSRFVFFHSVMMVCVVTYAVSWSGLIFALLPGLDLQERSTLNHIVISIAFLAAACLTYELCEDGTLAPIWRKRLVAAGLVPLSMAVICMWAAPAWPHHASQIYHASFLIPMGFILAALFTALSHGSRMALIQLIGWSGLVLLVLSRIGTGLGVIGNSPINAIGFFPVLVFEVLVSSLAVSYRLVVLRRERDAALSRHSEMAKIADTDYLTGIPNRRAFVERFSELLTKTDRRRQASALLLIDLDHFKALNDAHGHDVGDQILKQFAALLNTERRYEDFCARIGGEEFAVLVHAQTPENTVTCAERLCTVIAAHWFDTGKGERIQLTASIGVAHVNSETGNAFDDFYDRADNALYDAKRTGRDRVVVAPRVDPANDPKEDRRAELSA